MQEKGKVILRPPLEKDIFCCYECTERVNQVTMQNELDLKAWRLKQLEVEENCLYKFMPCICCCLKAKEKQEKLFPDPISSARTKALHDTNDALTDI